VKVALAQINPTVGDFSGNQAKIIEISRKASAAGANLVVFPELAVCGYPPADLIEKPDFINRSVNTLHEIAAATSDLALAVLCGYVGPAERDSGRPAVNRAALLQGGKVLFSQQKMLLPFYDVFDEQRYFAPAQRQQVFALGHNKLAITVCEDAWNDKTFWARPLYNTDPVESLMREGASLIVNLSASPYFRGKRELRREMLANLARTYRVPLVMVNQVGGNDSLVFDGTSMAFNSRGETTAQAASFAEDLLIVDTDCDKGTSLPPENEEAAIYDALVLGTRDYVRKCGFKKAIVGLSGGIDSALVAAIAVDALGKENVLGVGMPSQYSSPGSIDDARELASNLGMRFEQIPIEEIYQAFTKSLVPAFNGLKPDITEENLQSRTRGVLLMALSNKSNALVLTTGNKSEMSTGYSTLYGDMVGGLAVIGDVVKTSVYRIAEHVNRNGVRIPIATMKKPPSAELRPGQKDTDTLPPYEVLDPILERYVERYETAEQIASQTGAPLQLVHSVISMVERSEYKRQQAALVLKVTPKAFGMGRRFPIAKKIEV
jgi:NAD+ synthase/NAD+ synthase (glutamine-hydrolysing)